MKVAMLRRLPPLNALKAFEAAARHESFTRAAEELCVTQGAVSHQVKALEAELGLKLFNRERQRLVITEAGRDYLAVVRDALDRIALGTERLMQRQSSGVLTVSTSPDFAAKWLVHRLGRFAEAHPEIDLRISATCITSISRARTSISPSGMATAAGRGSTSPPLLRAALPGLQPEAPSGRAHARAADVLKFPLLHLDDRKDWSSWLEAAGVADAEPSHGPVLNRASMVIDAAVDGQGVALARTTLAAWDLINGRLVRPFEAALRLSKSYWIVCPKATSSAAQDRDVPRLAAGRGRRRRAPPQGARVHRHNISSIVKTICCCRSPC